jgi:hypothetical protein
MSVYLDGNTPDVIKQWYGFPPPENRLYGAMIGGPCLVIGIFWMGWSGEFSSVPWYVPALGMILLGVSITLIFISFSVCCYYLHMTCDGADSILFDRLTFSIHTRTYPSTIQLKGQDLNDSD